MQRERCGSIRGEATIDNLAYIGITSAGSSEKSNQDSLLCNRRFLPDTMQNFEEVANSSDKCWQIYAVTDGMGGSGIGDISGRLVQEMLVEHIAGLQDQDIEEFDFVKFIQNFLDNADKSLQKRLKKYSGKPVGCSLALVLICDSVAYTMSVGSNSIMMMREQQLYAMTKKHELDEKGGRPLVFLGNHPGIGRLKAHNLNRIDLESGDLIILMTDGMADDIDKLEPIFASEDNLAEKAAKVYQQAESHNPLDNKSMIVLAADGELPDVSVSSILLGNKTEEVSNKSETSSAEIDPFAPPIEQKEDTDSLGFLNHRLTDNEDEFTTGQHNLHGVSILGQDDFPRIADTGVMGSDTYLKGDAYLSKDNLDVYDTGYLPDITDDFAAFYQPKSINPFTLFLKSYGVGALIGFALVLIVYFFLW